MGGKTRSDNNKPWGTHRTGEIPPAQLEPRDPCGVELPWKKKNSQKKPTKSEGIHTQEETQQQPGTSTSFLCVEHETGTAQVLLCAQPG